MKLRTIKFRVGRILKFDCEIVTWPTMRPNKHTAFSVSVYIWLCGRRYHFVFTDKRGCSC